MKKILLAFVFAVSVSVTVHAQKNLLSDGYSEARIREMLIPRSEFRLFPLKSDRAVWDHIDDSVRGYYIGLAEKNLGYQWPALPATTALMFVRDGNRQQYENIHFEKRKMLFMFLMAEVLENRGRFTDQLIDGVWSVCEESYWGVPAHLKHSEAGEGLVDVEAPFVDLFAAETGRYLSLVNYFMKDDFDKVSPQISDRILLEIDKRVLTPVLTKHHMWMDFSFNWNTWICSSWLTTVLLSEQDENRRSAAVAKILQCLDNFLNPYPSDGGCDEGPSYWGAAGAALYESLDVLGRATGGKYDVWDNPKIRNIGQYITKVRLTQNYILNFADAVPRSSTAPAWVYFCGKMIGDTDMMKYGAIGASGDIACPIHNANRTFDLVLNYKEIAACPKHMPFMRDVWMERIQVMIARDRKGSDRGFVLAAKAGHNAESHNHNDVGSFVVYYDGNPVLIDVGSGTYTARTFNDLRYTLWFNNSAYHNVPLINGRDQISAGGTWAKEVSCVQKDAYAALQAQLQPAYRDAGLKTLAREVRLNRGRNVTVRDEIVLEAPGSVTENFMTCIEPDASQKGRVFLRNDEVAMALRYDPAVFDVKVEKCAMDQPEDQNVLKQWGDSVYRISFAARTKAAKAVYTFVLEPESRK